MNCPDCFSENYKTMKLIKYLLLFVVGISVCISCDQDDDKNPRQACIDNYLDQFGMVPYDGVGDIPCAINRLVLYENDGSTFAVLRNGCNDLVEQLIVDCEGNEVCSYLATREDDCFEMVQQSTNVGIIGTESY